MIRSHPSIEAEESVAGAPPEDSPGVPVPSAADIREAELRADLRRPAGLWWHSLAEFLIRGTAFGVVALIALVLIFLVREALPVFTGQATTARAEPPAMDEIQVERLPAAQIAGYLRQTPDLVASLPVDTLRAMIHLRAEELRAEASPDGAINAVSWSRMFLPATWHGYARPVSVWQPVSNSPKFNVLPLLAGSLKISLVAMLFAVPLAVGAAFYVSQLAPSAVREICKPTVELLAGIPTVVLGFLGLLVLAGTVQRLFGFDLRLNAFTAGMCVALTIIPTIFAIAEEVMTAVPASHRQAAVAMGATPWYAAATVVFPAALPGILSGVVLGCSRAVGETMIAIMVSGNAAVLSASPFDSARSVPATIAAELAEVPRGDVHWEVLFFLGTLLFVVTFAFNLLADHVLQRLRTRIRGAAHTLPPIAAAIPA